MLSKRNFSVLSVCCACFVLAASLRLHAGTATVTVDFNTVQKTLSPLTFSMDESGYGNLHLPDDPSMQAELSLLKVAMMRMNLGYKTAGDPNSGIVCMAGGATQTITGDQWIAGIAAAGALPQVRVQMNPANSQTIWVNDAKSLVTHFNMTPGNTRVDRWVIYNEPDGNGMSVATYSAGFIAMYNGMKSIDPTIKIGGPATASYNSSPTGFIKTFLQNMKNAGITPDFVDFHSYGTGSNVIADDALLAITTQKYATEPADLRAYLVSLWGSTVGNQIPIEIGEWNLSWKSDARQLRPYGAVWAARALCHMVESGVIERFYADKNGNCMGIVCDVANPTFSDPNHGGTATYTANVDDPMPEYHGIGMFTGEGLFPGFGSNVVTATETSSTGLIHAAASNNPRNIVAINSSPTDNTTTTFNLTGVSNASVAVWQKNSGSQSVVNLGTISATGGTFAYTLNAYTVTTFVVTPSNPPPPVPTNLAATPANTQVALTWTASSGATSYNVKRATTSGGPYSTAGSPTTNSFTNTGLTNGTTYYHVVSALNSNGESADSTEVNATPQPLPPAAPTNLVTTPGNAQIALTWTASSGATSYNVKRSTTNGGPYSTVGSPTAASFTDPGLTNGTTYYYVVTAVNGGGESGNSNQASATPAGGGGGGNPLFEGESLTVGASSGQVWRTSTDVNASGGALAFYDAVATGNFVTLVTPSVTAGTYQVSVVTKTANTRGTYQLATAASVSGTYTNLGAPTDQYAATQVYQVEQMIGTVTFSTTSTKAIRFTITGKNAASSGYGLAIDSIKLTDTGTPVAAPSFSPGGGTYTSAQSVTITTTTSGASIHYTTDGSTPTSTVGTLYSAPVNIAATTMLKAIAYKTGLTDSTVTSATYTINVGTSYTFEGESLTVGASSGQVWRTSTDSNASGGAIAFYDAVATGNFVTLSTPSITAGTYQVSVVTKTANTRGTYQLATAASVGGTYTNTGAPTDQYAASQVYQVEQIIGTVTFSTTSTKAIRFTITGKNAASSGYGLAIDSIKLIPQ